MLNTRLALLFDQNVIFDMVKKNYTSSPRMQEASFAEKKVDSIIKNLIEKNQIIVLEKNNIVIGVVGYVFTEHLFSYDQYIAEIMFYIQEDNRNFQSFRRLYKALEKVWLDSDVKELHMGSLNGYNEGRISKLYEFFGHKKTSESFKRVKS